MKTAKLFRNGQSQAVRLPKEFRFEGEQVFIQRSGNAVVLLPIDAPFQTLVESLALFTKDFTELPAHEAVPQNTSKAHGN